MAGHLTIKNKTMLKETLQKLFTRDLNKLKTEIELYKDESRLWEIESGIANAAGNLCLHLIGNLNTFIGAEIGKTGYVRDRPGEFSTKNIPKAELVKKIEDTLLVVIKSLEKLSPQQLESEYPILVFAEKM
jgi:hypothetical protein